ncbi:MAG TPA: nucleotidyltransferase family protein [Pyrinomonadaceae bacterium]|nr:nucleotidyltransferase family protein [Pyrinomonadaceae bacterium]
MDNTISKAVILARGLGTRMRADFSGANLTSEQTKIASLGIKTLMPVRGDKTLVEFILENLSKAGFSEICLVIGDEHQAIRDFCASLNYDISFAIQENPLGTAEAVLAAKSFSDGENFLVVNSDNLYPLNALRKLRELNQTGFVAFSRKGLIEKSNISEDKINKFATAETDESGHLIKIIEKPETVDESSLISMNCWLFSPKIFTACRQIKPSLRGEFEITDAVQFAIDNLGEKFIAVKSDEGVLDLSSRADVGKISDYFSNFVN